VLTNTSAIEDSWMLYGADGRPLGPVTTQAVVRFTFRDGDGNHQPDPGEVTANVDHFRLSCP
jgi:hypothetical protein